MDNKVYCSCGEELFQEGDTWNWCTYRGGCGVDCGCHEFDVCPICGCIIDVCQGSYGPHNNGSCDEHGCDH